MSTEGSKASHIVHKTLSATMVEHQASPKHAPAQPIGTSGHNTKSVENRQQPLASPSTRLSTLIDDPVNHHDWGNASHPEVKDIPGPSLGGMMLGGSGTSSATGRTFSGSEWTPMGFPDHSQYLGLPPAGHHFGSAALGFNNDYSKYANLMSNKQSASKVRGNSKKAQKKNSAGVSFSDNIANGPDGGFGTAGNVNRDQNPAILIPPYRSLWPDDMGGVTGTGSTDPFSMLAAPSRFSRGHWFDAQQNQMAPPADYFSLSGPCHQEGMTLQNATAADFWLGNGFPAHQGSLQQLPPAFSSISNPLQQQVAPQGTHAKVMKQKASRKRKPYVSKACQRCRELKKRCDGKNPCKRCADRECPCLYAAAPSSSNAANLSAEKIAVNTKTILQTKTNGGNAVLDKANVHSEDEPVADFLKF